MSVMLTKARMFALLTATVAMAEERDGVRLEDAAAELGVEESVLQDILEPLLALEYRPRDAVALAKGEGDGEAYGDIVSTAYAFELTERGVLSVNEAHWLRDMAAVPPDPSGALALFLAAVAVQESDDLPPAHLASAIDKLRAELAASIIVSVSAPAALRAVRDAMGKGRSLRFRYVKFGNSPATDREVEPHRLFSKWGSWYVIASPVGSTELRTFRVDGIMAPELGNVEYDARADVAVPEAFNLASMMREVEVDIPEGDLGALRAAEHISAQESLPNGRVSVTVSMQGAPLDNLLLQLSPSAEFRDPDLRARRAQLARTLLARYESPAGEIDATTLP
jgi:predicted DNA-binding transcriptional regulator YafY